MPGEFIENLIDAVRYADAALDRNGAPAERAKLRAQRFCLVMAVVIVDRDIRAALRQLARDCPADATRGARHERDLTGERA